MNKSTFLIATLAILCLVSKIAADGPYTRLFFTSSDCSEESRIAYYYMPTAPQTCQQAGCFEIVAGKYYGLENCTEGAAQPKDGWSVVQYSLVDDCSTTQIEYGAQPDTCFVYIGIGTNVFSYKLSYCNDGKVFLGNYPDVTCTSAPSLNAVNTTDTCTTNNAGGYYKHLTCPAAPLPPVPEPVSPVTAPISAPTSSAPVASTTPTKKSSTAAILKLDLAQIIGSLLILISCSFFI